mmetsp:Transcript_20014/g.59628  ORF Transcript_20014/g.59628 Transcript_20014/m.59628 type:complete len:585 (-) Transcript_20014:20-1774(-)
MPLESGQKTALASVGAAVAAGVLLGRVTCRSHLALRLKLKLLAALSGGYVLRNVKVPTSLLEEDAEDADAEGLVTRDVEVRGDEIKRVAKGLAGPGADCGGSILFACFVDAHTHMVKNHAAPRARNPTGAINDALATEIEDQPRWGACACCAPSLGGSGNAPLPPMVCGPCPKADDVRRRMDFGLATAFHHGTKAVRTHLDGTASEDPRVAATVWAAFARCRDAWGRRGLVVQGVANLYLPLWLEPSAEAFAETAAFQRGAVLGAYCGNVAPGEVEFMTEAARALFGFAHTHALDVDCHVDETNDADSRGLVALARALLEARENADQSFAAGGVAVDDGGEHFDGCEACGGGGDLVCCDYCPRAFHGRCLARRPASRLIEDAAYDRDGPWRCGECDFDVGGYFGEDDADDALLAACAAAQAQEPAACAFPDSHIVAEARLRTALKALGRHGFHHFFAYGVDPAAAPGYKEVVARPMDLGQVALRLAKGAYEGPEGPARAVCDVRAVFHACAVYNAPGSSIARAGATLRKLWAALEPQVARGCPPEARKALQRQAGSLVGEQESSGKLFDAYVSSVVRRRAAAAA